MADHGKAKRGIPPKSDFNAWYPAIVEIAELVDKRYPIKGMDVWRPYGWKAMRCIDALTHSEMERTDHEEVRFPLLIPYSKRKIDSLHCLSVHVKKESIQANCELRKRKRGSRKRCIGSSMQVKTSLMCQCS